MLHYGDLLFLDLSHEYRKHPHKDELHSAGKYGQESHYDFDFCELFIVCDCFQNQLMEDLDYRQKHDLGKRVAVEEDEENHVK